MTLEARELFAGPTNIPQTPRMHARSLRVVSMAAGSALLPVGTPLARNSSTGLWVPYVQPSDAAIYTVTNQSTDVDGGSFRLTIDGATVELAWNVTAAAAQTEINAVLAAAGRAYTVGVGCSEANLGVAAAVLTITFSENAGAPNVEYDGEDILDDTVSEPHAFAQSDAGTALNETNVIRGFVYDAEVQLSGTGEVHGLALILGEVYSSDVNTVAIRAVLGGSPSAGEINTALAALDPARILVRGLNTQA